MIPSLFGGMNLENQNAAKKRKNKLGMRRKGFIIAFLAPTLIAFCVFYLYPIITVFVTSFCKWDYTEYYQSGVFRLEQSVGQL